MDRKAEPIEGGIAIILPAPNCGLTLEEIARKDVPPIKRLVPSGIMKIDPDEHDTALHRHAVGYAAQCGGVYLRTPPWVASRPSRDRLH